MYKSVAGVIPAVLMVIAVSVLGVTQIHERQPDSVKESLILLVVAGFVQAIAWAVTFTLSLTINTTKARNKAYLLIQAVMCLYFIASGIVWICLTVSQSGKGSKSKSVTLAMIVLFVVSVIISSVTLSINIFRMLVGIESEVLTPSSSSFGDIESFQIQPRRGMTYLQELPDFSQTRHLSGMQHHLEIIEQNTIDSIDVAGSKPVSVSKKVSEQTLVDQAPVTAQNGLSSTIIEKHISEESNKLLEYSEIINASMIAKGRGSDELNNNMDNWMDTGSKIYTKGHDIPTDPPIATTNSTSRIISLQRKASNILPLNHSRSVPLFRNAKTAPTHTNFVEVESEFKQFKNKSEVHPEEEKEDPFEYQSRRISLIKTGSENTISDIANGTSQPQNQPFNIIKEEDSTQVKRSKSTSYINQNQDRISKREERWKSIHDEKVFLLNVNECLLPSVLKSGESYIMELKRQQESFNKLETETNIPEVETDVDDDENLPYIAEFDEHENYHKDANPNEDHHEVNQFDDFTQDTRILPKKRKRVPQEEDYMEGLEQIPQSTTYQTNKEKLKDRYISMSDWNKNSYSWNENRLRSASSGIHISVVPAESSVTLEKPKVISRPPYTLLNRSFSAPSLHTFRDNHSQEKEDESSDSVSSGKKIATASTGTTLHSSSNNLHLVKTPVQIEPVGGTSSSSPIKKFFNESPKRLSGVFKKLNSRHSFDLDVSRSGHKHSSSVVSNAFSMSSSKSGSPKKSLKSLLTRSTSNFHHRKNSSVPSINFLIAMTNNSNGINNDFNNNYNNSVNNNSNNLNNQNSHNNTPKLNIQTSTWHATPKLYSSNFQYSPSPPQLEAIDRWDFDLETTQSSDKSRVSSVPSAVIGEYDREKWRTLKTLEKRDLNFVS